MLAVFVVAVAASVWFVVWFTKRAYAAYAQAWAPLLAQVNGTAKGATLSGTYQGHPVRAAIKTISGEGSSSYEYYLHMTVGSSGKGWTVCYGGEKLLGTGPKSWHVQTKDEALKQHLLSSGIVERLQNWGGYPDISYKNGVLAYHLTVGDMFDVPTPEQFAAQLELLAHLAQLTQPARLPELSAS
ncbi:MAG TPA: hypothetical protein VFB38_19570 [Chthonomonadaceae bacterium]|nr:hypothetical protein [Chthonomonadaceae bacterium]